MNSHRTLSVPSPWLLAALSAVTLSVGCSDSSPGPTTTIELTVVEGLVLAGPTCPVEQPGQVCDPAPVAGTVVAIDAEGETVASTTTDAAGHYSIGLAPGDYTLRVIVDGPFPSCPETTVTVASGVPATVNIDCDTGIR